MHLTCNVRVTCQLHIRNVFWPFKCLSTIIALQTGCHEYWCKRFVIYHFGSWILYITIKYMTRITIDLCAAFLLAGDVINGRNMAYTRFEYAEDSPQACWYARSTLGTRPRQVEDTSRLLPMRQCASQSALFVRQKDVHNTFNIRFTK